MNEIRKDDQNLQRLGGEWIRALVEKDYQHLAEICQTEVHSRLMTPRRIDAFENAADLAQKVENWFHECSSFHVEQTRLAPVGNKLAIFYRLSFDEGGQRSVAEQQIYCTLRNGLIDQLSLLCSGFQPFEDEASVPFASEVTRTPTVHQSIGQPSLQADAILEFNTGGGVGPTCSILTPSIKRKLGEMNPGQVLEVSVDDPTAKEDVEAWCRLSGNSLLHLDVGAGNELHFYLKKKQSV